MEENLLLDKIVIKWSSQSYDTTNKANSNTEQNDISNRIASHFVRSNLKIPKVVFCESPMEAYAFACIFNSVTKIDFEINDTLNNYIYSRMNEILKEARELLEDTDPSDNIYSYFTKAIYSDSPSHIESIFDPGINHNEDYPYDDYTPLDLDYFRDMEEKFIDTFNFQLAEIRLIPDEWIPYEVMDSKSFGFSYLMNSDYISKIAFIDYCILQIKNKVQDVAKLSDLLLDFKFNIFNLLIFKDTLSDENYCLISKKPQEIHTIQRDSDNIDKVLNNPTDYAIKFNDGWGAHFIDDTYFSQEQFDNFIRQPISKDELNRLGFIGQQNRIIDVLHYHYGYSRPELYEAWRWFSPRDDEWPYDDNEEFAKLAYEREKKDIKLMKTSKFK